MALRGWPWRRGDDRVQLVDRVSQPTPQDREVLLRIAAEALILQDEAEAVLLAASQHAHLGVVAPRGGPLVSRFFALRDELPHACPDPRLDSLRRVLGTVLHHHALQVATALEFLACDGRTPAVDEHLSRLGGLGAPAALLEKVFSELRERPG